MPIAPMIEKVIELPEKVEASMEGNTLTIKGPLGQLQREFKHPKVNIAMDKGKIRIGCDLPRRKDMAIVGTWVSHVNNMIKGVVSGFEYHLKIVYSHFPMKVRVDKEKALVVVENFLGEKHPRHARIFGDAEVKVSGDTVVVKSINKEHAGQTAANIERATRIRGYDTRVFQDGIYIIKKDERMV